MKIDGKMKKLPLR